MFLFLHPHPLSLPFPPQTPTLHSDCSRLVTNVKINVCCQLKKRVVIRFPSSMLFSFNTVTLFFYPKAKLWETCHTNTGILGAKWQGYFILYRHYYREGFSAQVENYPHITAAFQTHKSDGPNNLQSTWLTEAHFDLEEISVLKFLHACHEYHKQMPTIVKSLRFN